MVSTDISVYAPEDEEINLESLTNLLAKRNYIPHEGLKLNGNFIVRKVNTNDDLYKIFMSKSNFSSPS
jgi:hypothetical protein